MLGVARNAQNFGVGRIDRIDLAEKLSRGEIGQNRTPDAALAIGGADHGNRFRPERNTEAQHGQSFCSHSLISSDDSAESYERVKEFAPFQDDQRLY